MKKLILKNYYQMRILILSIRLYVLNNDYNFVEADWDKTHLMKKIARLSARQLLFMYKIETL